MPLYKLPMAKQESDVGAASSCQAKTARKAISKFYSHVTSRHVTLIHKTNPAKGTVINLQFQTNSKDRAIKLQAQKPSKVRRSQP